MCAWKIHFDGQQYGASNTNQVRQWISEGRIPPTGHLYHPSIGDWITADRIEDYADKIVDIQPGVVQCPFCQNLQTSSSLQFTTAGVIVLLAGILFAPVGIGIILIIVAFGMRETRHYCPSCGRRF